MFDGIALVVVVAHAGTIPECLVFVRTWRMCLSLMPYTTSVGVVTYWLCEVMVVLAVVVVDGVVACSAYPSYGGVEVRGNFVKRILPIVKDVIQVVVTVIPIASAAVARRVYIEEVLKIYLIHMVILLI